jgi:lysophospholipase L1-like esterase
MKRLLALGDSYTIGEGVEPAAAWPQRLVDHLRTNGVAIGAPTIIATTGWTTTELAAAVAEAMLDPPYDLVTLQVGVNDQYRDWSVEAFPGHYAELLAVAVRLAGADPRRCLAISIPDWGVTPFAAGDARSAVVIANAIDRYNALAQKTAEARAIRYLDVTTISRSTEHAMSLVADGLHPSAAQYAAWVEQVIAPAASLVLNAPQCRQIRSR